MYLPYSGNFLKVQNFSVKLKHFPEEILEEFNSKSSYIIPHKVTCKLICHLSLKFEDLMVAVCLKILKVEKKIPCCTVTNIEIHNCIL